MNFAQKFLLSLSKGLWENKKQGLLNLQQYNMEQYKELIEKFWEWYYQEFAEEVMSKDDDIIFRERNSEKIMARFSELVGL